MMFIFDAERNLLAEVSLAGGALKQIVLSGAGERVLGAFVSLWQTRGIPVAQSIGDATYQEHVQPRSHEFGEALVSWANQKGYCCVETPDRAVHLWEGLARLPLEPAERFAFLLAIKLTPPEALAEWKSCLDEAELAWSKERDKTKSMVERIKQKMEPRLKNTFSDKK